MTKSVLAVERACDMLYMIAASDSGAGVTELADGLSLSKSAAHRILVALSNGSMVRQDASTQRYHLDPRILELATPFFRQKDLTTLARPFLNNLRDRFQETAVLALRMGDSFMSVTYSPSPWAIRFIPTVGMPLSLHLSAFGKAILANLPRAEIDEFVQNAKLEQLTDKTMIEPAQLRVELEQIRQAGFARSSGEVLAGNVGFAAVLLGEDGDPIGSVCVGGPEYRMQEIDPVELGQELISTARRLSAAVRLGGH